MPYTVPCGLREDAAGSISEPARFPVCKSSCTKNVTLQKSGDGNLDSSTSKDRYRNVKMIRHYLPRERNDLSGCGGNGSSTC